MVLQPQSPSIHNQLCTIKIPHPESTNFHDDFPSPPAKRIKTDPERGSPTAGGHVLSPRRKISPRKGNEVANSEDEGEDVDVKDSHYSKTTELESALPSINLKTDEEAIEAYEAYKAGEQDNETIESRLENRSWIRGRSSIYVDAFNLALNTVLEEEAHLFDDAEHQLFKAWLNLDYESQYLYVRLFLRKTSKWFRVKDLQYYGDIADIVAAVANLQTERDLPTTPDVITRHPGELNPPQDWSLGLTFTFAECSSAHITTLNEASSLLVLDELKDIAKDAKVRGKNKQELLRNFRRVSGQQSGLGFRGLSRTETEDSTGTELSENEKSTYEDDEDLTIEQRRSNRDAHFTKKILDRTGRCIRLSLPPLKLFERVHLIFYRSTEWTEKSLTTLILAKISRRNFPLYIVSRSSTIFESRNLLLEFEASLRTQFRLDDFTEFSGVSIQKELEVIREIFEEVYPRWKVLLAEEQRKEERVYESGEGAYLRRFNPAWVYTRIVHKGLHPLARSKEHKREHEILTELLDQRLFHAAKRGAWYQRKALLEEHYMHALVPPEGRNEEQNKKHWKRIAVRTCEEGLEDRECHIIYHYDLQKRIRKLEKQLRVPVREQHEFGHVGLKKATERVVYGIKIERESTPARVLNRRNSESSVHNDTQLTKRGAKTIWLDDLDTNESVSVESMCLSYYRRELGWKGYHSEGGILRMLFGLLFYDVLFVYVPNVFQTAYQTCPLDLHTDSFYGTRISEINSRLNEVANGQAEKIIQTCWDENFEQRTCIIGIRWDDYALSDLLEISRCFQAEALSTIMRVMAQEYAARGGGVPDLFLWKPNPDGKGGEVMFAEVKSENDRLSDTQRLWISVMLGAGIQVELCHALAREVRTNAD